MLAYATLLAVQPSPDPKLRAALDANPLADTFGPRSVREMYENYLGGPVEDAPLAAVPGLATTADVAAYPPVFLLNAEVDELRVSADVFSATLRAADRDVESFTEPGTTHGHLNRLEEPAATASLERIAGKLAHLIR